MQLLSRRSLLKGLGLSSAAVIGSACTTQVVQVTRVVQVEVQRVVEQTVVVYETVEVEKVVTRVVQIEGEAARPAATIAGELIFWGHGQHPMDLAATGFVERYPEIKWVSPHPADRAQLIRTTMAAGSGCPDLYWAEATDAQAWGCAEVLIDLTEELLPYKNDYHPLKLNETLVAKTGQYVGWPGDISVSAYYYRPDKFAEAGFPDVDWGTLTYDDFCLMSSEIAKQGMYTFVFPPDGHQSLFMYLLHQLGGSAISRDGQSITITGAQGIQAMEIVKDLWGCGGGLNVGRWSAPYWEAIQQGELIGEFGPAWTRGFWEAQIQVPEGGLGQWRLAPFMTGAGIKYRSGVLGGAQLVHPKCAQNRDHAIAFMKYAFGTIEGAALAGRWGIVPAYRPYLQSPLFRHTKSPLFGDWPFNETWAALEQELSSVFYRPAGWRAVNSVVGREMMTMVLDRVGIEEGLSRIAELARHDFDHTKCTL